MKILVVCKRQYTGRDLLDDNYGRLFEISESLCRQGHVVKGITLSYKNRATGKYKHQLADWLSLNGKPFSITGSFVFYKHIKNTILEFQPDIVWCSSDVWHIAIGGLACLRHKTKFVIDLYDNYESFFLTKLPLMTTLLRYMCRKSNGLTTVSSTLSEFVKQTYNLKGNPIEIVGNAINPQQFYPMNKSNCRQKLGLPVDSVLMGTAGALDSSRGIRTLFKGFNLLKERHRNLYLVIAGPRDKSFIDLLSKRIIDLGNLSPQMIPLVLNALDIAVICNRNSNFGKYCYPQKYEEISACGVKFVAADVGEISVLLKDTQKNLFNPECEEDLAQKIESMLKESEASFQKNRVHAWDDRSRQLASFFNTIIAKP